MCQYNVTGGIKLSVWDLIRQGGSKIKVSTELPVAIRYRHDMTERLLKTTVNPNNTKRNKRDLLRL